MQARFFRARHLATLIFTCLFLASFPVTANAAVLNVPAQYATIGAAVAAASSGDTIVLAPGTYSDTSNDLNMTIGKSLTFEASGTAADTIIDCGGNNGFINALGSNNLNLTFQNLTFQDCSSILLNFSGSNGNTIHINGCVMTRLGNPALETDAANNISITGCTITNNTSDFLFVLTGGTLLVANSTFSNNSSCDFLTDQITGTITDCSFEANGVGGLFGGLSPIFWQDAPLTINNTSFTNNQAGQGGGAIGVNAATADTPLTLESCTFAGNSITGGPGGAVYLQPNGSNASLVASDCVFLNNSSDTDGSAIGGSGDMQIVNCSFYGNAYTGGSPSGQGTISSGGSTLTITNSILYGDTTPNEISTSSPAGTTTVTYSDVNGGTNGVNNNIVADPKYASAATGDLHLLPSSPCIATGTVTGAPTTDFNQYAWGNTVSMGAFSPIHFDLTTPSTATAGTSFSFTTTAMAADDTTTITNFADTLHFTSSDASASLPIDSTLTNGIETLNATLNTSGNQTITATDTSTTAITGTSADIVVAGPATHFVVTAPSTATDVQPFTFTITALDANDNVATGYSGTVHFTSSSGSSTLPADSTLTNGTATLGAALRKIGAQTITGTDTVNPTIKGTSNTITVSAGPATSFFITAPSTATAGVPFSFSVAAFDALGNTAHSYSGTVHFSSTDGMASPPADATLTSGHGDFNATLNTLGNQTITATDTVRSSITGRSGTINVLTSAALTTFPAGLQMISAPSDYSAFSVSQIFNPSGADLAVWQPLSNSYAITPTAPADTIRPGQGYWVHFAATTSLLDIGQHVNETQPFSISLQAGWNMIGDPFAESIPLSQVRVVVNGQSQSFPTWPRPGAPVMSRLYTLPAGATQYQIETQMLKKFTGYWLFAFKDCTLVIPAR